MHYFKKLVLLWGYYHLCLKILKIAMGYIDEILYEVL